MKNAVYITQYQNNNETGRGRRKTKEEKKIETKKQYVDVIKYDTRLMRRAHK